MMTEEDAIDKALKRLKSEAPIHGLSPFPGIDFDWDDVIKLAKYYLENEET